MHFHPFNYVCELQKIRWKDYNKIFIRNDFGLLDGNFVGRQILMIKSKQILIIGLLKIQSWDLLSNGNRKQFNMGSVSQQNILALTSEY